MLQRTVIKKMSEDFNTQQDEQEERSLCRDLAHTTCIQLWPRGYGGYCGQKHDVNVSGLDCRVSRTPGAEWTRFFSSCVVYFYAVVRGYRRRPLGGVVERLRGLENVTEASIRTVVSSTWEKCHFWVHCVFSFTGVNISDEENPKAFC